MNHYITAAKRLFSLTLVLLALMQAQAQAQRLKKAEYFFDTDPGVGKGTQITLPVSKNIDSTLTFNVSALTNALHTVYVRAQDTSGKWSLDYSASFIKSAGGAAGGSNINYITGLEYFFDKDPGVGKGTQVAIAGNKASLDSTFPLNVSALSNGLHTVYIRTQDVNQRWSLDYNATFIKSTGGSTSSINYVTNVEYFFDKDPGVGKGTPIAIGGTKTSVDTTLPFNVSALSAGLHTLYVRAQDINQNWSLGYSSSFIKQNGNDSALEITRLEYYFDKDPGFGNGIRMPITAAANINDTFAFNIADNGGDTTILYVRAQDNHGSWSLVYDSVINECAYFKVKPNFGWVRFGSQFSFIDSTQNNPSHKLLWEFGGLATDSVSNPTYTFPQGDYFVRLVAGPRTGCRADSITLPVFVGLESYYPNSVTNGGDIVMDLYGGGLDTNAVVTLRNGSTAITPYAKVAYDLQAFGGVFDLHTAAAGTYDVEVHFSSGYDTTIVGGLQVGQLQDSTDYSPEIDVTVVGVHVSRPGSVRRHELIVTNSGSVLAKTVPVWGATQDVANFTPATGYNTFVQPDNNYDYEDSVPTKIGIDTMFGAAFNGQLNNFMIPSLNAGQSFVYPYYVQFPFVEGATVEMDFWASNRMYGSPFEWNCMHLLIDDAINLAGLIPGLGCAASFGGFALDVTSGVLGQLGVNNDQSYSGSAGVGNFGWSVVSTVVGCIPGGKLASVAANSQHILTAGQAILTTQNLYQSNVDAFGSTSDNPCATQDDPWGKSAKYRIRDINSADPNGIDGPQGYGVPNYISGKGKQGYAIDFVNEATATASAQRVYLADTLDKTKFDLSTFELTTITIGDTVLNIPYQRTQYTLTKDLRPKQNILLRINIKLDTATGILNCEFLSLDPVTKDTLSLSDTRGFLPPDVDNISGEGSLSYVINLKKSLATSTVVSNQASIIFDNNAAIVTNTWANTIDVTAPTGGVTGSTRVNDTTIVLKLAGSDVGVGIDHYALYFATNNGPYTRLGYILGDTVRLTGQLDSTYHFYAIGYDSVNNYAPKGSADYSITLNPSALPLILASFRGQYINGVDQLTAEIKAAINVKTVELQKSADGRTFGYLATIATGPGVGGTYIYNDANPYNGNNYYRLKVIDNDGNLSFSNIVLLDNSKALNVHIYPNPVHDNLTMIVNNATASEYAVRLSDITGRKLQQTSFAGAGGSQSINMGVSNYAPGAYIVEIFDASGNRVFNQKVMKE